MNRALRAAKFIVTAPLIFLLLVVINLVTWRGHWWVQWAALGLGIACVVYLLRVLKGAAVVGGLAAPGTLLFRRRSTDRF